MDNNDFLKSLSKSLIEATKTILEGKAHTVPKTEKEKRLAALAHPKDKITHADVLKGRGVMKEAEMDGVAAGSMEGEKHMCATKVFHKEWKEGTPVKTMHADPDENGLIEWYDVMFDHGIERVMTEDMKILQQESHMHSKKKMSEASYKDGDTRMGSVGPITTDAERAERAKKYREKMMKKESADYLETDLKKRKKNNDKAVEDMKKMGSPMRNPAFGEDVDQIDELSTPTLRKYREKARDDAFDADAVDDERRLRKRSFGHNQAGKKIIKRGDTLRAEEVQIDEARKTISKRDRGDMSAQDLLDHHTQHVQTLLKSISAHVDNHRKQAMSHVNYRGQKGPDYGHAGSMAEISRHLEDIHNRLARQGEYAESVEVEDEVTLTEAELQALEQIVESIEVVDEVEDLDEARGRPKLPRDAKGNIIRGGSTAKASVAKADEEPAALGYQLRKAASINKPVHFMNGEKKEVSNQHINAFNDHMAARKTAAEKAAFQSKAHKSHAEFVKAVSAPVPHAKKDTGEIVKYR